MGRAVTSGAWWMSPRAATIAALLPAVLTVFLCAHQLTLHGVLHGVVLTTEAPNIGSAIALTKGALPYSNFPLAQPPGMTIVMLPFAWLGHFVSAGVAIALARFATAAATVVAVFLAGYSARPYGIPASMLAGVFTATFGLEFFSTAGVTVGPWILLFTFLGISFAFQDGEVSDGARMLFAGLLLGFACTIKPWALIPAAVVIGCAAVAWQEKREKLIPAAGGILLGIVVPCLIFFLASPTQFWRDVIVTEFPGHGSTSAGVKFADVLGLSGAPGFHHPAGLATFIVLIAGIAIVVVALGGAASSSSYDWFITITSIAVLLAVLLPGSMSLSYGEFALPFVAIAVAMTVGRLVALVAASWSGKGTDPRSSIASALGVLTAGCAVVVASIAAPADADFAATYANQHGILSVSAIGSTIPDGACALADNPMLLIQAGRFAGNGSTCPVVVDPAGILAIARAFPKSKSAADQWQSWLGIARYLVLTVPPGQIPLSGHLGKYVGAHFTLSAGRDQYNIYVASVGSASA
ncbi:MAG: hypothetical protein ACLPQS_07560 [Acidimicrobiales bacterium]